MIRKLSVTLLLLLGSAAAPLLTSLPPAVAQDHGVSDLTITPEQKAKAVRNFLGHGYQLQKTFASGDSCTAPIFDLSDPASYLIRDVPAHHEHLHSGTTVKEYRDSFSGGGSTTFPAYGVAVTLKADFGAQLSDQRSRRFLTVSESHTFFRGTLRHEARVLPEARTAIDTWEPDRLFEVYGTHYTRSLRFGASVNLSAVVDERYSEKDIRVALHSGIVGSAPSPGAFDNRYKALTSQIESTRIVHTIGGDPTLAKHTGTEEDPAWRRSIPAHLNLAGLDVGDDLRGIWELASTPERRKLLEAAARTHLKQFEMDEQLDLVLRDSAFLLQNPETGKYLGRNRGGWMAYHPTLANERNDAEPLLFAGGNEPLKSGSAIRIRTTGTAAWPESYKAYDILGAFRTGVYYSNDTNAYADWRIELVVVDKQGRDLRFGDQVRLKNQGYDQYLYPYTSGGYPATKTAADPDTVWVLRKARE